MESHSAAENLQTIRTLMERSALYRRALAPIMMFAGVVGCAAAAGGCLGGVKSPKGFVLYWLIVAVVTLVGVLLLVRRQALKSSEAFWSPPTRRVAQALLPAFFAGAVTGSFILVVQVAANKDALVMVFIPGIWGICYGCALHAAGFFISRGFRIFGWLFVIVGIAYFLAVVFDTGQLPITWKAMHLAMGGLFGLLQLAYGIYLSVTGEKRNEL